MLLILHGAVFTAVIGWVVTTTSTGEAHDLVVTGAYSAGPLLQKIAARFQGVNPRDRVAVDGDGSERGLRDVEQGRADVGLVARDPTPVERRRFHWYSVARDAVAVIVHAGNPVAALTRADLAAVYGGRVTDWSALRGGAGGPIRPLTAPEDSALRTVFDGFLGTSAGPSAGEPQYGTGMLEAVADDPAAVGYASFAQARVPAHPKVETVAVNGVAASPEAIADGGYPMSHGVYLVTRAAPAGIVDRFIRYATSPAVQDLVRDGGFVPAAPRPGPPPQ